MNYSMMGPLRRAGEAPDLLDAALDVVHRAEQ
jgi:hypothetical protein